MASSNHNFRLILALAAMLALLAGCVASGTSHLAINTRATLAVLETTDLHTNVLSYDYFKLAEDKSIGFERVATLIKAARTEFTNNVLLDNGDTIQGTALADYQAQVKPLGCDETLAMYKVMNLFAYDGAGVGNHEFNYGLPFLNQVTGSRFDVDGVSLRAKPCAGPNFPMVLANVYSVRTKATLFSPFQIITKTITATAPDGTRVSAPLKIGIIGFAPTAITAWDKRWLEGKVYTEGVVDTARKYLPEMRRQGAELVVALAHGGLDSASNSAAMDNPNSHLAQVLGIDVLLMGHTHQVFPNATSTVSAFNQAGIDKVRGTVNSVPAVMAGYWGKNLGVVKLELVYDGSHWTVNRSATKVQSRPIQNADKSYVVADTSVAAAVAAEHAAAIAYVKTPIGSTDFGLSSYFADVGDVSAIQIVNQAQAAYVATYVAANLPQYAHLPVLSVSAPFKSGFAGGRDFTDVAPGDLAIYNAADLYLYPNTVHALRVQGSDIKNWLEMATKRFNTIDPSITADQALVSSGFPGFNFDMFTSADISYEIDVTQAVGSRIHRLRYKGAAIDPAAYFIVATNNYRASGGGGIAGIDGSKTIYASPDSNQDVLITHIRAVKSLSRANNGLGRSWRFSKVSIAGRVTFKSAPGKLALAQAAGLNNISVINDDDGSGKNLADYAIDLSQ
jgi:2',3'-cyclic-nucleotide 2'-phosphodiesterase/3'-nucleotidase